MKDRTEEFWSNVEKRIQDSKDRGAKRIIRPLIDAYAAKGEQGLSGVLSEIVKVGENQNEDPQTRS